MACVTKRRGRYVLDFYVQTGERQRVTLKKGTTKKRANLELMATLDAVEAGVYMPARRMPLFSEVAEDWLKHKKANLRITSWEVCEGHTKNHYTDLDNLKIGQVTTATVEKWIRERQEEGMSLGTLRKVLVTLGQIMAYAVRHRYVRHNPVRDAERPRETGNEVKGEVFRILSPAEIRALLNAADSEKYKTLYMMAIFTGARQGELLGLKWSDVEWETKQVHVQRNFTKGRFFDTKTKTSRRKIDLAPTMLLQLKKWKLACPPNEPDLVLPNEAGQPMNYSNMMSRHYVPALVKACIATKLENGTIEGAIRFHDLRHTFASLLIAQGENIKYVQAQLGHSSPMVTPNVYAHLMKPTNQEAAERLEKTIFQGTGQNLVTIQQKGVTA